MGRHGERKAQVLLAYISGSISSSKGFKQNVFKTFLSPLGLINLTVFSLHPRWCRGDARDEQRIRTALEADPESIARLHYVNFLSGRLSFPLLAAVVAGHERCARVLAEAEVVFERRGVNTAVPALARALVHGRPTHASPTLALLLHSGARANYTGTRGASTSFLELAVRFSLTSCMLALLEAGAETEDWDHVLSNPGPTCTPLLQACTLSDPKPLHILLRYGAHANPQARGTPSPAHVLVTSCAKRRGDKQESGVELLTLLHEHGSDIWRRGASSDPRAPLECARTLPVLYFALVDLTSRPATLLQLSRACIRSLVPPRRICTLPVPEAVKTYCKNS